MQDLIISGNVLEKAKLSPSELLVEIAVHLYDKEKLSMGQARNLAGLPQLEFQKAMAKRGVLIKYDIEDFEEDLNTLKKLDLNARRQ